MAKLFFVFLSLAAATLVSAQTGSICSLNQNEIQKVIIQCVAEDPMLFVQFLEHMKNPESMATMDFMCQNQKGVVHVVMCLEDKLASCFPSAKDNIKQYLPDQDRLDDAVRFMCEHRKDLLESNCMDQSQLQDFMQCYLGKLTDIIQTVREDHDIKTAACNVIHSEELCIKTYHGSCSKTYIDLVIQLLDKLFPYCPVLTLDVNVLNNQAVNDAMGSILFHGQPLKFQPKGGVKYDVVNG